MKISKHRKLNKYEYWFAAGKVSAFRILPQLVIAYDKKYKKWYYHFAIELGWILWNVGVFFKHSEL